MTSFSGRFRLDDQGNLVIFSEYDESCLLVEKWSSGLTVYDITEGNKKEVLVTGECLILNHLYSELRDGQCQEYFEEIPVELRKSLAPVNYMQDLLLQMSARSTVMHALCIHHRTQAMLIADILCEDGNRIRYLHEDPIQIIECEVGETLSLAQWDFIDKCQPVITRGIYYGNDMVKSMLQDIKRYLTLSDLIEGFQTWQVIPRDCIELLDILPKLSYWDWFRECLDEYATNHHKSRETHCSSPTPFDYHQGVLLMRARLHDTVFLLSLFPKYRQQELTNDVYSCKSWEDISQFENQLIEKIRNCRWLSEQVSLLKGIYQFQIGSAPSVINRILD